MPHPVTASNSSFKIAQRFIVNTIISQQDFPFSGDQQTNKISRLISPHWRYSVAGSKYNHRKCFSLGLNKYLLDQVSDLLSTKSRVVCLFVCLRCKSPKFLHFLYSFVFFLTNKPLISWVNFCLRELCPPPQKKKKGKEKKSVANRH